MINIPKTIRVGRMYRIVRSWEYIDDNDQLNTMSGNVFVLNKCRNNKALYLTYLTNLGTIICDTWLDESEFCHRVSE